MGIKYDSFLVRGIDVSVFNGIIDWSKVDADFAGIRVGYGNTKDAKFDVNVVGAKNRKMDIFGYWYSDYYSNWFYKDSGVYNLSDVEWGKRQADNCYKWMKAHGLNIVYLDIENMTSADSPKLTQAAANNHAQEINRAFLERMDELGVQTGIYTSVGWLSWFRPWFRNRPLWVAWYNESVSKDTVISSCLKNGWLVAPVIWQWSSEIDILGIGQSDVNGWIGSEAQYNVMFGHTVTKPDDETQTPTTDYTTYKVTASLGLSIRETPAKTDRKSVV